MDTSHAPAPRPTLPSGDTPERDLYSILQDDTTDALRNAAERASVEELSKLIEQLDPSRTGFAAVRARRVTRALPPSDHNLGELADAPTDRATSQQPPASVFRSANTSPGTPAGLVEVVR